MTLKKYLSFKDLSGFFCVLQGCVLVGHDKLLLHEEYITSHTRFIFFNSVIFLYPLL